MSVKTLLVFCIQSIILKAVLSQCIGAPLYPGEGLLAPTRAFEALVPIAPGLGRVVGANIIVDTKAAEPAGVSIVSENLVIGGTVLVSGSLPFLGTVGVDGLVPTTGSSAVAYACGNGNVAMTDVPVASVMAAGPGLIAEGVIL